MHRVNKSCFSTKFSLHGRLCSSSRLGQIIEHGKCEYNGSQPEDLEHCGERIYLVVLLKSLIMYTLFKTKRLFQVLQNLVYFSMKTFLISSF